ncbi:RIKEN cDNA 2610039C10, isoform CRA_b [Mus musculus]|nr:RIKEN cDNA 2610039C10, isoform CRA_b [Mus musculus]
MFLDRLWLKPPGYVERVPPAGEASVGRLEPLPAAAEASPVTSLWIRNRNCPSAEMKTVASLRRCTARAAPSALAMCTDALLRTWTTSATCSASALKPLKVTP